MYFLTMYNISEIQKAIQAGHAQQEYCNMFGDSPEFKQWAFHDKTWMVMNGGTSNRSGINIYNNEINIGSMEKHFDKLKLNNIPVACFHEPDLNNAMSAIAFLVGEKCWDKEKYPDIFHNTDLDLDLDYYYNLKVSYYMTDEEVYLRSFIKNLRFA